MAKRPYFSCFWGLGAVVTFACTAAGCGGSHEPPASPRCLLCPVHDLCRARASGREAELPHLGAKKPPRAWSRAALVLERDDEVLLTKRRGDRLFGGMWEPPAVDVDSETQTEVAPPALEKLLGLKSVKYTKKNTVKHVLSHRKMDVAVLTARLTSTTKKIAFTENDEYDEARWVTREALAKLPASTLCKKILAAARAQPSQEVTSSRPRSARPKRSK